MMRRNLGIWAAPAQDDDARCAGNSSAATSVSALDCRDAAMVQTSDHSNSERGNK